MSFYGDLASIAIGDLFQNFEANRSTGTFTLKGSENPVAIYFQGGKVAMAAAEDRPPLVDSLVTAGLVSPEKLRAAKTRRRGSRKSMVETLIAMRAVTEDDVRRVAITVLHEDLCDLVASAQGAFDFKEGKPPARVFDPEERRLELGLPIGPMLLEAARRSDHWELIRKVIPSDSAHFVAPQGVECPPEIENPQLAQQILRLLDGTRDVREVTALFHHHRFAAYVTLSQLVRERLVRAAESDDLVAFATQAAEEDPRRARAILARGLEAQPQHLGLLQLEANLAADQRDSEGAAAALKMMAHLKLEAGQRDEARAVLQKAHEVAPSDTTVCERLLTMDIEEKSTEEALRRGMDLVALYRAPGLHTKAREVLERLSRVAPQSLEVHRQLARSQVDAGDPKGAVQELARVAQRFVKQARYADARALYEEILGIDPGQAEATHCIELIDSETYKHRRVRLRRFLKRTGAVAAVLLVAAFVVIETLARADYVEANSVISRKGLIEEQRYDEAMKRYQAVAEKHPYSTTTWIDIRFRIEDLSRKVRADEVKKQQRKP